MTSTAVIENWVSDADAAADNAAPFQFVHSEGFAGLLEALGATLFVSTYQAGKLVTFRARDGRVSMLMRSYGNAMAWQFAVIAWRWEPNIRSGHCIIRVKLLPK